MAEQKDNEKLTPEEADIFTRCFIGAVVSSCTSVGLMCAFETMLHKIENVREAFITHPVMFVICTLAVILSMTCGFTALCDHWVKVLDRKGRK